MGLLDGILPYFSKRYGEIEPVATMATGLLAEPVAGWAGLLSGDSGNVQKTRDMLTYQPRTQQGKQSLLDVNDFIQSAKRRLVDENPPVNMMANAFNSVADYAGERSPFLGAAVRTLPTAAATFMMPGSQPVRQAFGSVARDAMPVIKQVAENTFIPSSGGTSVFKNQKGQIFYHGSNNDYQLKKIDRNEGVFGGLFASPDKDAAFSHGDNLYRLTVPNSKILTQEIIDKLPSDVVDKNLRKLLPELDQNYYDDAYKAVVDDSANRVDHDSMMKIFGEGLSGNPMWEAQRVRGELSKQLGYSGVAMSDEHGTSYLLTDPFNIRPYNSSAKNNFKK